MTTQGTETAQASSGVSITIKGEALSTLMEIANQKGKSPEEALSEAIGWLKWAAKVKKGGKRVLLEKKGKFEELTLP